MDKYFEALNRDLDKSERPFYILPDNAKSVMHIKPLSLFKCLMDKDISFNLATKLAERDYLDNEYLKNKKNGCIIYRK